MASTTFFVVCGVFLLLVASAYTVPLKTTPKTPSPSTSAVTNNDPVSSTLAPPTSSSSPTNVSESASSTGNTTAKAVPVTSTSSKPLISGPGGIALDSVLKLKDAGLAKINGKETTSTLPTTTTTSKN